MPGLTAWYGLHRVGAFRPGDVVYVSGAAGAVGSTVGQLVKLGGGTVIGSTSGPAKSRFLREQLGFDQVFDRRGEVPSALAGCAPAGIDLYFDNVGGSQLDAALGALRVGGRVVACGQVSTADGPGAAVPNLPLIVGKRLTMTGFIISDHYDLRPTFEKEMIPLIQDGSIQAVETVLTGLDRAPEALIGLLTGTNLGKMIVGLEPAR
jgi:NADPH-dependent curcumin reductase CurA